VQNTPTRNVLCLSLDSASSQVEGCLQSAGWTVCKVANVSELHNVLSEKTVYVGLVEFNQRPDEKYLSQLDKVIRSSADVQWVGLSFQIYLDSGGLQKMISSLFYDFHTFPLAPKKLLMALGTAHSMTKIKLGLPINRIGHSELIGESPQIQVLLQEIEKEAKVSAPVLINGESGTGKELAAKAIHDMSHYSKGPFIAVNCGAIASGLVQAEFFGYEKGAFTGAFQKKIGYIEAANNGTLFLDEIGDLPLSQQINLLRFLQEKTIQRVGGTKGISVDVRVIAATHDCLETAVLEGKFRDDLYYRLNVLQLDLAPLREREGDIELLAYYFFSKFIDEKRPSVKGFSNSCIKRMKTYGWPGNIREMMNRIRRSMVMSDNKFLTETDLGIAATPLLPSSGAKSLKDIKAAAECDAIRQELLRTDNITLAASDLGISRVMLYRLMTKYNIDAKNPESV